jgi:hypothetical protein
VREVDQLQDAVDERVAERHERVDGARRQADDRDVEELRRVVDQVPQQHDHDERDEDDPEDRRDARTAPPPNLFDCACVYAHRIATSETTGGGPKPSPELLASVSSPSQPRRSPPAEKEPSRSRAAPRRGRS